MDSYGSLGTDIPLYGIESEWRCKCRCQTRTHLTSSDYSVLYCHAMSLRLDPSTTRPTSSRCSSASRSLRFQRWYVIATYMYMLPSRFTIFHCGTSYLFIVVLVLCYDCSFDCLTHRIFLLKTKQKVSYRKSLAENGRRQNANWKMLLFSKSHFVKVLSSLIQKMLTVALSVYLSYKTSFVSILSLYTVILYFLLFFCLSYSCGFIVANKD